MIHEGVIERLLLQLEKHLHGIESFADWSMIHKKRNPAQVVTNFFKFSAELLTPESVDLLFPVVSLGVLQDVITGSPKQLRDLI